MALSQRAVVKMAEMPRGDEIYQLRWLGALRWTASHGHGLEIQTLMASASGRFLRLWMPLDRLPLLVLGSRWHRQTAIRYSLETRPIHPDLAQPLRWQPAQTDAPASPTPADWLDPRFPNPSGTWRVQGRDGGEYYLPVSELIRTHYVFDPRLLPSILGGVSDNSRLTGRARQAWYPEQCRWLDQPGGQAYFRISRFMSNEGAFRLARLWFNEDGRSGLTKLFHAFRRLRVPAAAGRPAAVRGALPTVALPYRADAEWEAATVALPPGAHGQPRHLILKLLTHSAPPPWQELHVDDGVTRREPGAVTERPAGAKSGAPVRLEPIPKAEVKVTSDRTDGRFNPLRSRDLKTIDREAELYRSTRKTRPAEGDAVPDPRRSGTRQVDQGGADVPGGAAHSPVLLPGGSAAPEAGEFIAFGRDLRPVLEAVRDVLRTSLDPSLSATFLPSRELAHRFELPSRNAKQKDPAAMRPDRRVKSRQLLIFEISLRGRYAYAIEPSRRSATERFPIGIVTTRELAKLSWEDILDLARTFEIAARAKSSWVQAVNSTLPEMAAVGIDHLPENDSWNQRLPGLIQRLAAEVLVALQPNTR